MWTDNVRHFVIYQAGRSLSFEIKNDKHSGLFSFAGKTSRPAVTFVLFFVGSLALLPLSLALPLFLFLFSEQALLPALMEIINDVPFGSLPRNNIISLPALRRHPDLG